MPLEQDKLEEQFADRYERERALLDAFWEKDGLSSGERTHIQQLDAAHERGLEESLRRLGPEGRTKRLTLFTEFVRFGAKAVLLTGSQRGGDFLNNQLRGQWAEQVAVSMNVPGLVLLPFGPSAAAMPGEADHRETIMTFRAVTLIEGKRPDLLAFDRALWDGLSPSDRALAETWPSRVLTDPDDRLVAKATAGVEVKNSTWHYKRRRAFGGGALSITVKAEEVHSIEGWQTKTGVPVIFFQVLFDELYCMSFRRMCKAIDDGLMYKHGDFVTDSVQGAGGKVWHRFHLDDYKHLCGDVTFPDASQAVIRVLENGSVVPYIAFTPAHATCTHPEVIGREIKYRRRATSRRRSARR